MIKNNSQHKTTKEKISELKKLKEETLQDFSLHELERNFSANALQGMISNLEEQAKEYEDLKYGNLSILKASSLEELPDLLIKARIAQGMSQTELGRQLKLLPQQIQRYESVDYQNIAFHRLLDVARAVGVCVSFENTIVVGSGPKFEIPSNVDEAKILEAEIKSKEHCSLVF